MPDYVVYHKKEVMGYGALDVDNLSILTSKPTSGVIGSNVWLIAGEGKPRNYKLRAVFRIHSVHPSDNPDFKYRVVGRAGQLFDPMPPLDSEPWFPELIKEQGRFAFGFNPIKSRAAEVGLRAIQAANAKP